MNQVISADIMDKLQKISLCKGISKASIKKAIKEGAKTLHEVEKALEQAQVLAEAKGVHLK